jgi:D-3-phosphoglycerate dehydrogenase
MYARFRKKIFMKVLANDGISASGVTAIQASGHELFTTKVAQEQLVNFINEHQIDVVLVRSATTVRRDLIDACSSLKGIGRGGVGMDNIDVDYAREKGLKVFNTPAASSDSVAELVMGHMRGLVRFLHDSNRQMPLEGDSKFGALKKSYAKGVELRGRTLGIVGFGRIGQALSFLICTRNMWMLNWSSLMVKRQHSPVKTQVSSEFYLKAILFLYMFLVAI